MKFSQFNSIVPFQEQHALYNSYTQKVLFMVKELKELLETFLNTDITKLSEVHPSFFQYLKDEEFIVDKSCDEIKRVKDLGKTLDENQGIFLLTINPTMDCNFKCWYCYENHVKQSQLSEDVKSRVEKFIDSIIENKEIVNFNISFFGGEPLLYFKKSVIPIIEYFREKNIDRKLPVNISFTTNGYLINQSFINYFKKNNIGCSCQITLDGCKEDHDKVRFVGKNVGSYDKIVKNIHLLIENGYFVRLRINYTNSNIQKAKEVINDFIDLPKEKRDKYLMFDFHRVWQNDELDNTGSLLEENIKELKEKGFKVTGPYSPNNVVESCYADKRNSVIINYNGDIFKCTAREFDTEKRAGYIDESGALVWENNYLEDRMNLKYKNINNLCYNCKIMPLCNGGCSQHISERAGEDYCVFHNDEQEINKVVITKVEEIISNAVQ